MHTRRFFCSENGWDCLNEKLSWIHLVVPPILCWTISHVAHWSEKVAHPWSRNIFVLHHCESRRWLRHVLVQSLLRTGLKSIKDTNSSRWSITMTNGPWLSRCCWPRVLTHNVICSLREGLYLKPYVFFFFSFSILFFFFFSLTFLYVFLFLFFFYLFLCLLFLIHFLFLFLRS